MKDPPNEQIYYLFADHLGSTNVISDPTGASPSTEGIHRQKSVFSRLKADTFKSLPAGEPI